MANGVYIGMSAALASQSRLEIVSNNIANANTVGYKQQKVVFDQVLVETLDGSESTKGFTSVSQSVVDSTAGELERTGNPLDLAIKGEGYFMVRNAGANFLTRAGNLQVAPDGTLTDASGMAVLGGSLEDGLQPIVLRPDGGPVRAAADGTLEQGGTPLARLAVVTAEPDALVPQGNTHFSADEGAIRGVDAPQIAVGFLEASNVNVVRGMVELIEISQDHQTSHKLMSESRKLDRQIMSVMR